MSQQAGFRHEIQLLTAKLLYVMGDYAGALSKFQEVDIDNLDMENVSNRRMRIVAEAYAIKGMKLSYFPEVQYLI